MDEDKRTREVKAAICWAQSTNRTITDFKVDVKDIIAAAEVILSQTESLDVLVISTILNVIDRMKILDSWLEGK